MRNSKRALALATLPLMAAAACSDGTGVGGPHNVAVQFQVAPSSAPGASAGGPHAVGGPAAVGGPLVLVGSNGTLAIDQILLIVSEVELEAASGSCVGADDSTDDAGDGCEEFDAGPRFLDLPLDGQPVEVMTDFAAAGTYDELEFEIEDLEDDEDDSVEAALIAAVRAQVRAAVPDWPDEASALVVGSFTPTGGSAVDFRVFLKAEIELEMQLSPPLVIEGGVASRSITIDIEPEIWFRGSGGAVLNLSIYDFGVTDQLLEFDVEFEDGFTRIEVEG